MQTVDTSTRGVCQAARREAATSSAPEASQGSSPAGPWRSATEGGGHYPPHRVLSTARMPSMSGDHCPRQCDRSYGWYPWGSPSPTSSLCGWSSGGDGCRPVVARDEGDTGQRRASPDANGDIMALIRSGALRDEEGHSAQAGVW